ncbi:MAG: SsrA-binding protein SmpB [Candidatus Omnitrophica bacterium]|nr:SsrA-binding protein SmpB [Candidatus Omnitrophota bacterium]
MKKGADNAIVTNRQARRDYAILESIEAGIELKGTEVKSLRGRRANLKESFARIEKGEVILYNFHISPYEFGNIHNVDPMRPRKLLLHKNQILRLYGQIQTKSCTLIPLKVYFKKGFAKVEIALAKGKRKYDKRETIKRREAKREIDRALHRKQRG